MSALQRLIGSGDQRQYPPSSSGSESKYSADEWLSEMVVDFLEEYSGGTSSWPVEDLSNVAAADCTEALGEIRRMVSVNGGNVEPYRAVLVGNVQEAAEWAAASSSDSVVSQRRLMVFLHELRYNAAICKTKWESSRDFTSGSYEFIDVINGSVRYLIDMNFPTQFEIARPTIQYRELLKSLPLIFIGTTDELKKIVKIMCNAAKRSLNCMNLSVPPWRKYIYMKNKWLGPHRRIVNLVFDKPSTPKKSTNWAVKCQCIGFDNTVVEPNKNASICVRSVKTV
ncbi:uncharacterized protein LOC111467093 [Cucurbita maxima]|uniref:Uncharacterized protein LOC111467093 n=1 Tax=Cucurbita maxima TaxID=3661 RepID=A0A6J1HXB8_CUCMA|nr:uncharacterized protein LOC111467093 [Cucurbita maxima]